ncbi:MAG: SDR family NAD(P)-dependent oxidoreductase [Beijerinckiaceae bacterium]|jgi:short-subunit dehydrogenase
MPRESKRALITGAGSGIGRALAVEAASRGIRVALTGRRQDPLDATARLIVGQVETLTIPADVTIGSDRRALVANIAARWGALDFLFNNAGVVEGGPVKASGDEALERVFATNVIAPIALARDFLPLMLRAKPARVVNIGSVFGDIPYPGFAAYSASKFALRGFSTALRREWAEAGIGVTYAAPRATRTEAAAAFSALIEATKMTLDPPELVARQIWDAVERGDQSVYPRGAERVFVLIQRLFPRLVDRALAKQTAALAS